MAHELSRRGFLAGGTSAGLLSGLGDLSFLSNLDPVSAAESTSNPAAVKFLPKIEPLVRLLEDTPRGRVLEEVADRLRNGATYRQVVTAVQLAGIRNVQPRPSVGFKFHAVLVVNSAHLAAQSSPESDRWLPIFWAIDEFKASQARDVAEGDWTMSAADETSVRKLASEPGSQPQVTMERFRNAMNRWQPETADLTAAALARTGSAKDLFPLFARLGCRDFRSIGHKAIFVANGFRTLQHIGWQHSEPILRSIAYALQNHQGEPNPADNDLTADRPWRHNQKLAARIKSELPNGSADADSTRELVRSLRTCSATDASDLVADMFGKNVSVQSVTDGLYLASVELLLRQRGIIAMHAVTTTNALQYAFRQLSADGGHEETRRLLLLQNASFLPMFRDAMRGRGQIGNAEIDELQPVKTASATDGLEDIYGDVGRNHFRAAGKTLNWLNAGNDGKSFIDAARRLIFLKGNNSHDYKFSSATLEDYAHISPAWRNQFLAASVLNLRGTNDRDNGLVQRTRAALKS
jgi:hypothetical protein